MTALALFAMGPDPERHNPYPRDSRSPVPDEQGPRWFRVFWPVITAFAGMALAFAELAFWGARPAALLFIAGMIGLGGYIAAIAGRLGR